MSFCVTVIGLHELEEEHCRLWANEETALAKNSKSLPAIVPKGKPFSGNTVLAKINFFLCPSLFKEIHMTFSLQKLFS